MHGTVAPHGQCDCGWRAHKGALGLLGAVLCIQVLVIRRRQHSSFRPGASHASAEHLPDRLWSGAHQSPAGMAYRLHFRRERLGILEHHATFMVPPVSEVSTRKIRHSETPRCLHGPPSPLSKNVAHPASRKCRPGVSTMSSTVISLTHLLSAAILRVPSTLSISWMRLPGWV